MIRLIVGVCACALLASCGSDSNEPDTRATKLAEHRYRLCLTEAAARLDDGRSEAAAIGASVAGACYPQFLQEQIADGDDAREQALRAQSSPDAVTMYQQDFAQQNRLATQAVLAHRRQGY